MSKSSSVDANDVLIFRYEFWPDIFFRFVLPNLIFVPHLIFLFSPLEYEGGIGSPIFYLIYLIYLVYLIWMILQLCKGQIIFLLTKDGLEYPYFEFFLKKVYANISWEKFSNVSLVKIGYRSADGGAVYGIQVTHKLEGAVKPFHGSLVNLDKIQFHITQGPKRKKQYEEFKYRFLKK